MISILFTFKELMKLKFYCSYISFCRKIQLVFLIVTFAFVISVLFTFKELMKLKFWCSYINFCRKNIAGISNYFSVLFEFQLLI